MRASTPNGDPMTTVAERRSDLRSSQAKAGYLFIFPSMLLYLAFVERQIRYSRAMSPAVSSTA